MGATWFGMFADVRMFALRDFGRHCSEGSLDFALGEWERLLAELPSPEQVWSNSIRETYRTARIRLTDPSARREMFDSWYRRGVIPEFPSEQATKNDPVRLKPHRALRRVADYCRLCLSLPPRYSERLPIRKVNASRWDKFRDPYGDHLVTYLVGRLHAQRGYIAEYEQTVHAARILIALRSHLRAHGQLPENLESLVPDCLESVPVDPLVGGAWKYDRARGLIWCGEVHVSELETGDHRFRPHDPVYRIVQTSPVRERQP